ncbi:putative DIC1-mitochondrial dicarboxylate carrier protein [Mrakia frigida]|uniref:putative DIC1-mitochondrial dicarboxylate carrier protein n=1 Tax=Mrakia frigida TaxID=29902 RepID=UPI003FCC0F89
MVDSKKVKTTYPFWVGCAAASMASVCTHPLDLLRVRMQMSAEKAGMVVTARDTLRADGPRGLYPGLSASILRQMTYSVTRFGTYEYLKDEIKERTGQKASTWQMLGAATVAGIAGGIAGNPADIILVRMTADATKPLNDQHRYRNCFDGLARVVKEEGAQQLFRGLGPNLVRSVLMNTSQLVSYDWFKDQLKTQAGLREGLVLHAFASLGAGTVATTICAPADVIRSRVMSASGPGSGPLTVLKDSLAAEGPAFMFKGWTPAWIRLAPNTVLIFVFLEQIRKVIDKTRL